MLRTGLDGERVAFADWTGGGITDPLTIGRPGVRLQKQTRNTAAWALLAGIYMMGCRGGCGYPWMPAGIDPEVWTSVPPVVRPDGRYAYVANTYTTDVAAIDTGKQAVAAYFALDGRARGLFLSRDRNLVCAYSKNRLIVIDAATNTSVLQANPAGGIRRLTFSPDGSRILAVTDHLIAAWDAKTWRPIGVLDGLSKPALVMGEDREASRQ
jgi:DNA-binding beta-propeller fold protein YncE